MNDLKKRIEKFKVENIAEQTGIPASTIYNWLKEDDSQKKKFMKLLVYLEIDLYEYANSESDTYIEDEIEKRDSE